MQTPTPHQVPPDSEHTLLLRAQTLAGYSLAELARIAQLPLPADLKRDKGWIGVLLERFLGASAGSKPEQDFPDIGIELKNHPGG
ncbi:hypothetical protein DZS_06330 [Dickeya ananatis]